MHSFVLESSTETVHVKKSWGALWQGIVGDTQRHSHKGFLHVSLMISPVCLTSVISSNDGQCLWLRMRIHACAHTHTYMEAHKYIVIEYIC